jgi:hypothetical protein
MPLTEGRALMKRTTLLDVSNFTQRKRVAVFLPRNLAMYVCYKYYNLPSSDDLEATIFFLRGRRKSKFQSQSFLDLTASQILSAQVPPQLSRESSDQWNRFITAYTARDSCRARRGENLWSEHDQNQINCSAFLDQVIYS